MSSRRRVVGIVAAIALAVVGTVALVAYVKGAEDRALAGEKVVDVYVTTQEIEAGTPAADLVGKVRREQVPVKVQARGAIDRLGQLDGSVTAVDLVPGEQLLRSRFAASGSDVQRSVGGSKIPTGWFQSTVLLEPEQALGGSVKAGQRVTVVASVSQGLSSSGGPRSGVVARNALVTNVQIDGERGDEADRKQVTNAPTGKFLVTLAMPQPELEQVVFATTSGKVWLATEPGSR